jgi:hypothetical protein
MDRMKPTLKRKELKQTTARDFSGGLDLVDSEFNLASKYGVASENMVHGENGDLQVRWGTRRFGALQISNNYVVGMEYYFSYIIAVMSDGTIYATDGTGTSTLIWSSFIASSLAGAPSGWSATTNANFTQFLGNLIITNGIDKPLVVDNTLLVQYLQDLGTGTNINTPITKYAVTHSNYVIMAGDPNAPGRIYISNAGTSGTWPSDPLPNDAITFDVDKYAPDSIGEITGMVSFRDRLLVFFSQYIVSLKLGVYNTAATPVHTPAVDDVVESYGAVSHKGIINLGDKVLFLDYTGVSQIKQTTLTQQLVPDRVSKLIDPAMHSALSAVSRGTLLDRAFAVHDRRENRVMWFIPPTVAASSSTQMTVFAYNITGAGKYAWSMFTNWIFSAGCGSVEGRVFFGGGTSIYRHGSRNEPILSDYENYFPTSTRDGGPTDYVDNYVYGTFCPQAIAAQGIKFYYELPQNALGDRTLWKSLHYLTMDTEGASKFTVSLWLDDLKKRTENEGSPWSDGLYWTDGTGWYPRVSTPYLSMEFAGGDRNAHNQGNLVTEHNRRTDRMNLFAVYGRFRFFKLAFSGTSYAHLRIVGVSLYHSVGSIY